MIDPQTGDPITTELFVAVWGASTYTFAEATLTQQLPDWIGSHTRLAKIQLLIIDDLFLTLLDDPQRNDLVEIIEDRYQKNPTVITSQCPIKDWHSIIGEPTVADGILDRLLHHAYKIELKGESIRKPRNDHRTCNNQIP